ncbi:ArsC family reductase [Herminiimonas sp. CN]|uniref:ArsC family reductase n=1 Tax=Herminiimonas sp. CN TaxID=1349818 RepID=UPI0005564943|nr:ArsC family reductase [Herminiimonas sp. CN]
MNDSNPNITLYGIPNCATVKKARSWLDAHALPHTFHNFKKDGVTPALIEAWLQDNGWEVLLNRKGTTWRALDDARKAGVTDAASAMALMCAAPSVIKRPVLTIANAAAQHSYVGFADALYQQIFTPKP